jgi:hypothetical protein
MDVQDSEKQFDQEPIEPDEAYVNPSDEPVLTDSSDTIISTPVLTDSIPAAEMVLPSSLGAPVDLPADGAPAWYVIHCYSGYENKVRHNLEQRIETMGIRTRYSM